MKYTEPEKKELVRMFELYRLDKGLSIKEASELVKVNSGTITRWEELKSLPHKVQCYAIEKVIKDFIPSIDKH